MKKEKTISVLIRIADSPVRPKNLLFSLTGCFALLFLGGLGFFSSVKDMSAVPGAVSFWIFPLAGVALLLTFLFGLFLLHKKKRLALLLSGGLLCSLLLFQRKALLAQGSSFLGYLHARLERFYGISLFSGFSGSAADNSLFFFFCTLLFLILVCLTLWYRKKVLFLFLLLLAPVAQFVTEIRPSFLSAGCFLVCFFLWDCLSAKETSSGFLQTGLLFGLYCFCALVLTPGFSALAFQSTSSLFQTVNEASAKFGALFHANSADRATRTSKTRPTASGNSNQNTVSTQTDKEVLDNTAPVYSNQTMFTFHTSRIFDTPVYLRGFTGFTYTDGVWEALDEKQWKSFCSSYGLSDELQKQLPSIPYEAGKAQTSLASAQMSLKPAFSPSFTYLPYGADIPKGFSTGDGNVLTEKFPSRLTFDCYPLSLDSSPFLRAPSLPSAQTSAEGLYREFVQNTYTWYDKDLTARLLEDIQHLPVYSSLPENPSYDQVLKAAGEIQSFLSSHASYSLQLSPVPANSNLLDNFLYEQKKGFCVHFATAGTLLFRMYGIPARYVSGYVIIPEDLQKESGGGYSFAVPDSSAHAWTEIYLGEGGWVPVEVTPAASDTSQTVQTEQTARQENMQTVKQENLPDSKKDQPSPSSDTEKRGFLPVLTKILFFAMVFFITAALLFFLLYFRRILLFRKRMGIFCRSREACFLCVFNSILDLWKVRFHIPALNPQQPEFPVLFGQKLPEETRILFDQLYTLAECFCFGADTPKKQDIRKLRHIYARERKLFFASCSPRKKLYYLFFHVF